MKKYYSMAKDGKTADLMIYGDITSLPFFDSDVTSYDLCHEIASTDADRINVHINSYGGECSEAMAIVNALNRHKAKIVTYNDGFACSAAATIFMAGDERIASPYCAFLFHNAWTTVTGNAVTLRAEADNLDTITDQSKALYLDKTALLPEELDALMAEERFLTPEEALEIGFATEIEGAEESEATQAVKRSIFQRFMKSDDDDEEEEIEDDTDKDPDDDDPDDESDDEDGDPDDDEPDDESDDEDGDPDEDDEPGEDDDEDAKQNVFRKFMKEA